MPQPDAAVPRFPQEAHLAALMAGDDRRWPQSTQRISEVSVEITYESKAGLTGGPSTLILDIVDYPGEWLLDLPLIEQDYASWAAASFADARRPHGLLLPLPSGWTLRAGSIRQQMHMKWRRRRQAQRSKPISNAFAPTRKPSPFFRRAVS